MPLQSGLQPLRKVMNRKEQILSMIDPSGVGLEIGPLFQPIAPKREGFNVRIVDRMSRAELCVIHPGHEAEIEEVDYIFNGHQADIPSDMRFDWIIASHVIEHAAELIGFLNYFGSLLTDGGVIALAIPDKRYCFDCFRPMTGIARIIDTYFTNAGRYHSLGTIAESYLYSVSLNGHIAWAAPRPPGVFSVVHPQPGELIKRWLNGGRIDAHDFHAWVFTPTSFRLIIHDLNVLGFIRLHETAYFPTQGCEFFMTLTCAGISPVFDRLEMLRRIADEQATLG